MKPIFNRKRKALSNIAGLIVLALVLIGVVGGGLTYLGFINVKSPEPPELKQNITTLQGALIDLKNIGCAIVNVTQISGQGQGMGALLSYSEFRKVAYKKEMVFCYSKDGQAVLFTNVDNIFAGCGLSTSSPSSQYTKFEKVEVSSASSTSTTENGVITWTIVINLKNTGTAEATIQNVFINDKQISFSETLPSPSAGNGAWSSDKTTLVSGDKALLIIIVSNSGSGPFSQLKAGTTIGLKFHSVGGMDYLKLVELATAAPSYKFEKVEVVNAIVTSSGSGTAMTWTIKMSLKNTGTSSATITDIYLNDQPLTNSAVNPPIPAVGTGGWYSATPTIASGSSATFVIVVKNDVRTGAGPFKMLSSGTTVNFKLHSSGGMDYLKLAELV